MWIIIGLIILRLKKTFFSIPNMANYKINSLKKRVKLIILPGGNDIFSRDKISKVRLKVEFNLIKYAIKKVFLF